MSEQPERRHSPDRRHEERRTPGRRKDDAVRLSARVAANLRDQMARRKMSGAHLSQRSGVAEGTIRRVLLGENTSVDQLAALASTLRIDVADLFTAK